GGVGCAAPGAANRSGCGGCGDAPAAAPPRRARMPSTAAFRLRHARVELQAVTDLFQAQQRLLLHARPKALGPSLVTDRAMLAPRPAGEVVHADRFDLAAGTVHAALVVTDQTEA